MEAVEGQTCFAKPTPPRPQRLSLASRDARRSRFVTKIKPIAAYSKVCLKLAWFYGRQNPQASRP